MNKAMTKGEIAPKVQLDKPTQFVLWPLPLLKKLSEDPDTRYSV